MPPLTSKQAEKIALGLYNQPQFVDFRAQREAWDKIIARTQVVPLPDMYQNVAVPVQRSMEAEYAHRTNMQELGRAVPVYEIFSRAFRQERKSGAQAIEHFMNRQRIIWCNKPDSPYILTCASQDSKGAAAYKLDLRSEKRDGKYGIWSGRPVRDSRTPEDYAAAVDEYKLSNPTPFTLEYVNILTCAWSEDKDDIDAWVEMSKKPRKPILEAYGFSEKDGRLYAAEGVPEGEEGAFGETLDFMELCTPDYIYHFLKHPKTGPGQSQLEMVQVSENPFGAVRYRLVPGYVDAKPTVGERYRPLIELALEVAEQETLYDTMRAYAAASTALPVYDLVTEEDSVPYIDPNTGKPIAYIIEPFKPLNISLPPGTKLQPRVVQAGIDLDKMQAMIEAKKQRYGPQDVLTGGTAGEREAAWGLAIRGERAEHGIRPGLEGQRKAWKEIARMVAWCIKNWINEDVLLWTVLEDEKGVSHRHQVRVKPDDIEEDFDIDVDMRYRSTAIQLAKQEALRRAKEDGDASRLRYQEEGLGIDDPERENTLITMEKVERGAEPFAMWDTIEATIYRTRQKLGLPPPTPEEVQAMQMAFFGIQPAERAQERRVASPVRAAGLENPPTPTGQRPV